MPSPFKRLALLLVTCLTLLAQVPLRWTYAGGYTVAGTSAKLTLQLPTSSTRKIHPLTYSVVCGGACTVTLIRNGTTATATAGTVVKNRTANPTAHAQLFTASDSTGGTSFPAYPISGGGQTFDLSDMEIIPGENVTISVTSSVSQNISPSIKWEEY
ncbi:MAG: hypothetical protein ABI995_02945 [Acidobacteriota bacterium]